MEISVFREFKSEVSGETSLIRCVQLGKFRFPRVCGWNIFRSDRRGEGPVQKFCPVCAVERDSYQRIEEFPSGDGARFFGGKCALGQKRRRRKMRSAASIFHENFILQGCSGIWIASREREAPGLAGGK